jgi:Lrp/AsnC family transcriptional regulator, leucine-responsive regulatory protein
MRTIDEMDSRIIDILQTDARVANAEIARQVGMAPSATLERLRKLEERGVVRGYTASVDPRAVGLGLLAFVFVRAQGTTALAEETERALAAIPEAQEVHHIAGEDCFILKVRVADAEALGRLLRQRIASIPTVVSTRTTIVLNTVKETTTLPMPAAAEGNGHGGRSDG